MLVFVLALSIMQLAVMVPKACIQNTWSSAGDKNKQQNNSTDFNRTVPFYAKRTSTCRHLRVAWEAGKSQTLNSVWIVHWPKREAGCHCLQTQDIYPFPRISSAVCIRTNASHCSVVIHCKRRGSRCFDQGGLDSRLCVSIPSYMIGVTLHAHMACTCMPLFLCVWRLSLWKGSAPHTQ